ncbi:MAG: hypothetical protein H0U50_03955 [Pyrinomonadaceae bacterium]|nr:hypothetical protein [Pyrinomonadaceae bacterium]
MENQSSILPTGRIALAGESKNNSLLKTLLAADNLHFEETTMLPPQIEKSQTLLIRLKNQNAAVNNALFDAPTGKTELFLRQVKTSDRVLARQRSLELSTTQILIVALIDTNLRSIRRLVCSQCFRSLKIRTVFQISRKFSNSLIDNGHLFYIL